MTTPIPQVTTVTMIDAIGADAQNIPRSTPKVAGYVTGSGDVPWAAEDWALFPHAGHVRIDQSPGLGVPYSSDVKDSESGAATTQDLIDWARARQGKNWPSAFYMSTDHLDRDVIPAVERSGLNPALIFLWIADWSLDEAGARALVGRKFGGMECVAVQWASPSSNPGTPVPGGTGTLASANVDLSVAAEWWHHAPVPPPANWLRNASAELAAAEQQFASGYASLGKIAALLKEHGG